MLAPRCVSRFNCIGPACEDTCCANWEIEIDQPTLDRYNAVADPKLAARFRDNLRPAPEHTPFVAAHVKLTEANACPFLNEQRLCDIQTQLGEDALSNTCLFYPRALRTVGGMVQQSLLLSCPEAARLALLDPNAMDLVTWTEPLGRRWFFPDSIDTSVLAPDDVRHHYWDIRALIVQLLRCRDISLETRLFALGLALRKLTRPELPAWPEWLATFTSYVEGLAAIEAQLANVPPQPRIQVEVARQLIVDRLFTMSIPRRYRDCVTLVGQGLGLGSQAATDDAAELAYTSALECLYLPYMRDRPHVMENFVLNAVWSGLFPFVVGQWLFDGFAMLVVRYALAKLHLVGVAAASGELTDDLVVRTIQPLQRAVDHDPQYLARTLDLLRKHDVTSMAFMAILISS